MGGISEARVGDSMPLRRRPSRHRVGRHWFAPPGSTPLHRLDIHCEMTGLQSHLDRSTLDDLTGIRCARSCSGDLPTQNPGARGLSRHVDRDSIDHGSGCPRREERECEFGVIV